MKVATGWAEIVATLALLVGAGTALAQESLDLGTEQQRERGAEVYDKFCSQCHGAKGDGGGFAAPFLRPRPRDFTAGLFKIRTTPSGAMPVDEDLANVIRNGMPYTSMIGWPDFTDKEAANLIHHIKSFSPKFEDSEYYDAPITIPDPPPLTNKSLELGREIYTRMECFLCHGDAGRGDGTSAPDLRDDAEYVIWAADLTKRWTFRGGPTRKDIYRTFSTGLNGTPMPSYADSLTDEERWHLVDYVYSFGQSDEPNYSDRLVAAGIEDAIDISKGEALFERSPRAYFPLVGQIMEPGRAFHPATNGIEVKAVHNGREIAFLLKWHDMRPDMSQTNSPALEVPLSVLGPKTAEEVDAPGALEKGGFFGESEEIEGPDSADVDFFGETIEPQAQEPPEDDFFGDVETPEQGQAVEDDFFGELPEDEDASEDFFAIDDGEKPEETAIPQSAYSDAVAIQFPSEMPQGIRLPYFIFGDLENSVDIWFADLAQEQAQRFTGRGSKSVIQNDAEDVEMTATYEDGEWSVIFKQKRPSDAGVSFGEGQWIPIAFSVWDGWSEERGNNRALTSWFNVYIEPLETLSPVFPMTKAASVTLILEIILIAIVRKKYKTNLTSV